MVYTVPRTSEDENHFCGYGGLTGTVVYHFYCSSRPQTIGRFCDVAFVFILCLGLAQCGTSGSLARLPSTSILLKRSTHNFLLSQTLSKLLHALSQTFPVYSTFMLFLSPSFPPSLTPHLAPRTISPLRSVASSAVPETPAHFLPTTSTLSYHTTGARRTGARYPPFPPPSARNPLLPTTSCYPRPFRLPRYAIRICRPCT